MRVMSYATHDCFRLFDDQREVEDPLLPWRQMDLEDDCRSMALIGRRGGVDCHLAVDAIFSLIREDECFLLPSWLPDLSVLLLLQSTDRIEVFEGRSERQGQGELNGILGEV